MRAWKLWSRGKEIKTISVAEPRLASWEKSTHPAQVRLRAYLDDLVAAVGPLPDDSDPLFLHLSIDVGSPDRLLRHYDLENYLTPLFGRRWFNPARFVLVSAAKYVGGGSHLTVGVASPRLAELTAWKCFSLASGSGPQSKAWKENLRTTLAETHPSRLPDGPAKVQLAWRCSPRRNWVSLWKPTGDAMGPVLGTDRPESPFNPRDDRTVSLALHRNDDPDIGNDIHVGMWWRAGAMPSRS